MIFLQTDISNAPWIYYVLMGLAVLMANLGIKELLPQIFNKRAKQCERNMYQMASMVRNMAILIKEKVDEGTAIDQIINEAVEFADRMKKDIDEK